MVPLKQSTTCLLLVVPITAPVTVTLVKTAVCVLGLLVAVVPPRAVPVIAKMQGIVGATPHWTALVEATDEVMHALDKHVALQLQRTAPVVPVLC
ncbi:MAG TPA: hypothetical protein VGK24_20770 [Candidatus Angelobacter sp.]